MGIDYLVLIFSRPKLFWGHYLPMLREVKKAFKELIQSLIEPPPPQPKRNEHDETPKGKIANTSPNQGPKDI